MEMNTNMASQVSLLSKSLQLVPPAAIPPMLDCILGSTGISPVSLFAQLLDAFSNLAQDILKEIGGLDPGKCNNIGSLAGSLCHLLKKSGNNEDPLNSFVWRCFIPLVKMVHGYDHEILNQTAESLLEVVTATNSWRVLEATLVPFFLRLIGLSMGKFLNDEFAYYKWSTHSLSYVSDNQLNHAEMDNQYMLALSWSFPLNISCHVLSSILDAAMQSHQAASASQLMVANDRCCAENIAGNLLWDLCNMTLQLLSKDPDHRSCAVSFLIPCIFKAFVLQHSFEISNHGNKHNLSRKDFFAGLWSCCKALFSLGTLERRDAYTVLSQYLSFVLCDEECEDASRTEEFDIMNEVEFWNEAKRGLVDKEGFVRKQSLHILKMTLHINGQSQCISDVSEKISAEKDSTSQGMTKREIWADKEANSLGVGKLSNSVGPCLNSVQKWDAFLLLYDMLEEYGTHLVEAAWDHQIQLLLHSPSTNKNAVANGGRVDQNQMETLGEIFYWLPILWERGLCHDNPQVRCLIMQSFLGIEWRNHECYTKSVPETFVLGPFIQGLNDPVHHQDFGMKGSYSSKTIEGASVFLYQFAHHLNIRNYISFLSNLASAVKQQSLGRVGLMGLAECIASAASGVQIWHSGAYKDIVQEGCPDERILHNKKKEFLDVLRFVIESSKQHFNLKYRLQVCRKVVEAAASAVCAFDVPHEIIVIFITALPRELIDYGGCRRVKGVQLSSDLLGELYSCLSVYAGVVESGTLNSDLRKGPLRAEVQKWLLGCGRKHCSANCIGNNMKLKDNLHEFAIRFISPQNASINYDDEDLDAWEIKAKQYARVLFLVMKDDHRFENLMAFIRYHGVNVRRQSNQLEWIPVRFLILVSSFVHELQIFHKKTTSHGMTFRRIVDSDLLESVNLLGFEDASTIFENFCNSFLFILEELVSFAELSCSMLWSTARVEDTTLPCSIKGRLGGASQRRLPTTITTAVLKAIISMKTVAFISSWCQLFKGHASLNLTFNFLWSIIQKIGPSSTCKTETGAEICLAAYEILASVLKPLVSAISPIALNFFTNNDNMLPLKVGEKPVLDSIALTFLQNINNLLTDGVLARSRRAVLMNLKWLCVESLLSVPDYAQLNGVQLQNNSKFFSDAVVKRIFSELVESLENAGEESVLPMMRSVRFTLELLTSGRLAVVSSCDDIDSKMMWDLVHSSWVLHVNCNKRRVAPIAALLSSALHASVFQNEIFHVTGSEAGPLKWFIEKILEEGTKSPRTIRLTALHLTGMWLLNPKMVKYYMKELKLLSLYGSVAFDEDFEAELAGNPDAKSEVSCLAKSPIPELTERYINTELYARVSVAVLFYKLADVVDSGNENGFAALESGKLFLLELLDSAVNDSDLSKELYKKYSAIHRRKIRVWQMICILSRFVNEDIVQQVARSLHTCLYRNNLPAVRQYLETFAVLIYLKFPSLVLEHLVPILRDYNMKPQALSSYVFIAANIILHASEAVQSSHLDALLPPIVPLLTSHHHSLRGFTQLLVYHVLSKLFPLSDDSKSEIVPVEKKCFVELRSYLGKNSDCARLRSSMEGYLDAFDPKKSSTPSGIFTNRVEELEFECVPTSLMEQVLTFLNDVRDDLRCSMAKDAVTIQNEKLRIDERPNHSISLDCGKTLGLTELPKDMLFDFQKKITLSKHEVQGNNFSSFPGNKKILKSLGELENEDLLLEQLLRSRSLEMEKLRGGRQQIILVASLLDRIPNLAGLARTCEVFKAASLAIADASVLQDKQFQLISVSAEKWVPIIEVPVNSVKVFLQKKKREGFSILGLEQTANSIPLDEYKFPKKMVLLLGREKEGIPVDIIHMLDACIEIPQLGVVRSLNVHVSGAIALWEYTRQQRSK